MIKRSGGLAARFRLTGKSLRASVGYERRQIQSLHGLSRSVHGLEGRQRNSARHVTHGRVVSSYRRATNTRKDSHEAR